MNYTYILFSILFVGIVVLFWFIAEEFQRIATMKGHYEKRYFWWSFLLPIVGYLMVIALPDRTDIEDRRQT